jgi:hypothetical protein
MAKPLANLLLPGTPPKIARGLVGHATTDSKTVSWQSLQHQKLFTPATLLFIKYLQAIDNLRTPFSHTRCAILNTVEEVRRRKRLRHHRGGGRRVRLPIPKAETASALRVQVVAVCSGLGEKWLRFVIIRNKPVLSCVQST